MLGRGARRPLQNAVRETLGTSTLTAQPALLSRRYWYHANPAVRERSVALAQPRERGTPVKSREVV
jgi:hypothetical protein